MSFVAEKRKPTEKVFPDRNNRQGMVRDGFPSGKVHFPWQSITDGTSLTVTVTESLSWRFLILFLTEMAVTGKKFWGSAPPTPPNPGYGRKGDFYCAAPRIQTLVGGTCTGCSIIELHSCSSTRSLSFLRTPCSLCGRQWKSRVVLLARMPLHTMRFIDASLQIKGMVDLARKYIWRGNACQGTLTLSQGKSWQLSCRKRSLTVIMYWTACFNLISES